MWVVASTALVLAAASTVPVDAPPKDAPPSAFPSQEAFRRYAQGRLMEERGEGTEALSEFYRVLLADPRAANVARRISELSAEMGQTERSLEFADRSLAIEPRHPQGLWLKGVALFQLGRSAEALTSLQAAVAVDSNRVEYLQALARVAEQLDHIDVVARAYARAIELDENDGESWFQLAAARARLQDFSGAQTALDHSMDLNPARPGSFFRRGWV
jgi:tetratricopeptide (TPR) repeat protein